MSVWADSYSRYDQALVFGVLADVEPEDQIGLDITGRTPTNPRRVIVTVARIPTAALADDVRCTCRTTSRTPSADRGRCRSGSRPGAAAAGSSRGSRCLLLRRCEQDDDAQVAGDISEVVRCPAGDIGDGARCNGSLCSVHVDDRPTPEDDVDLVLPVRLLCVDVPRACSEQPDGQRRTSQELAVRRRSVLPEQGRQVSDQGGLDPDVIRTPLGHADTLLSPPDTGKAGVHRQEEVASYATCEIGQAAPPWRAGSPYQALLPSLLQNTSPS